MPPEPENGECERCPVDCHPHHVAEARIYEEYETFQYSPNPAALHPQVLERFIT